jgi:small-conductance mechanosensitive channel
VGFHFPYQVNLSTAVAKITFLVWFAAKLSALKTQFILRKFRVTTLDKLGKGNIYDRVGNLFIFLTTGLIISDVLALETGRAFSSIFALGSVSTLVFSLASKDIASQFIGGLALSASNKFYEGEEIKLGDNTVGIVSRVGWMNTEIRGYDEIIMKIPNSQLANQRVSNVSRMRKSQVKQFLWIGYNDIYKIPQFIEDVKTEIKASCPLLIDDGSRPFWVHWREYASDHLEIVVDTHHNIKPSSVEYYNNRQAVLLAIARAAKTNRVEFAVPHLQLKTNNAFLESSLNGESMDRPDATHVSKAAGIEYQSEEIDRRP